MYGSVEQVGWDQALKLAQHMQSTPNASLNFKPDKEYYPSRTRDLSRMTQFFKVLGAIRGDRQGLFYAAHGSDFRPYATIQVVNNKEVDLYYGLEYEDYGEYNAGPEEADEEEEEEEARIQRIFDAFEMPLPT